MVGVEGPQHGQAPLQRLHEVADVPYRRRPRTPSLTSLLLPADVLTSTLFGLRHRLYGRADTRPRKAENKGDSRCGYVTRFGSLETFEKGGIEIIDDDPKHYVFSNIFEVAASLALREGRRRQELGVCDRSAAGRGHVALVHLRPRRVRPRARRRGRGPPAEARRPDGGRRRARTALVPLAGEPAGRRMGRSSPGAATWPCCPAALPTASTPTSPACSLLQTILGDARSSAGPRSA